MVTQAQLLMPTLVRYLSEMLNSASGAVGVEGACTMSASKTGSHGARIR